MQQDQQQSAKETTIFALNNDYYKSLLYFELETTENCINILNETNLKLVLNANELISNHLQSIYVLHGNKKLLIVCKPDSNPNHVAQSILNIFEENKQENFHLLKRKCIPFYHNSSCDELSQQKQYSSQPLLLVAEVNDAQLKLINTDDKNTAIKAIESKTGLRLKKSKKTFYFSGLLFQFVILNDFLNEKSAMDTSSVQITQEPLTKSEDEQKNLVSSAGAEEAVEQVKQQEAKTIKTDLDWHDLYLESSIRGHFMLKPKPTDNGPDMVDFFYDVFIFEADLTDLNTDGIVNAANPNLHPGYIGDGISRRIREKAGKQMQDACKRIIRQDRNNVLIRDSEVVFTKSYGKLKSKYVLHSVAPTWTKYVASVTTNNSNESSPSVSLSSPSSYSSSSSSSSSSYKQQQQQHQDNHQVVESNEKFETLLEQTFVNLFKQAHDSKLQLNSIAIPVMSTSLGGAFDIPLDLCAHILYTQLVDFKLTNDLNKNLKTICITSLETNTVKVLCDIFSNYTECYAKSTWALPLSPFSRLLNIALEEKQQQQQQEVVNEVSREVEQEQVIDEELEKISPKVIEPEIKNEPAQEPPELISSSSKNQNISNNLTNISVTVIQQENTNENSTISRIISLNETNFVKNQPLSLITIKNNNQRQPRTMSNSSSNSSSHNNEQQNNTYHKQSDQTNKNNRNNFNNNSNGNEIVECLFCQKEIKNKLISCGSQNCIAVFCYSCITNYLTNQKTQKCPACRLNFDKNILNSLNKQNSTHLPVHERLSFNTNSNNNTEYLINNNYHHHHHHHNHHQQQQLISKNAITDAKIYVKVLDEPCDGYEKFRTLIVTFEVDDGIQNVN
jgi:O-acetyl-ADP-ribose deacetylase (regulator of RNase III)